MGIPEQLCKGLRLDIPSCIPVYDVYSSNSHQTFEPVEYRFISLPITIHRRVEAYVVHSSEFAPTIASGDIIMVDRNQKGKDGDTVACLIDNVINVGKLRKTGDELYLENQSGNKPFQKDQLAGVVIDIERWRETVPTGYNQSLQAVQSSR